MAIQVIRVIRTTHYTTIANAPLRDKHLSLRARGLLVTCLSHSSHYDISVAGLQACLPEGRDSIRKALNELKSAGYAQEYRTREASGRYGKRIICMSDTPREWPETAPEPETEKPVVATVHSEPQTENPSLATMHSEPETDLPAPVNPPQRNTNKKEYSIVSLYISAEEREKIELVFHSEKGYAEWKTISQAFIDDRSAVGWLTNAGRDIVDKCAYARGWNVQEALSDSIFASDEAAAAYRKIYQILSNAEGVHILTTVRKITIESDKGLVLHTSSKEEVSAFLTPHSTSIKQLVNKLTIKGI